MNYPAPAPKKDDIVQAMAISAAWGAAAFGLLGAVAGGKGEKSRIGSWALVGMVAGAGTSLIADMATRSERGRSKSFVGVPSYWSFAAIPPSSLGEPWSWPAAPPVPWGPWARPWW